jgi:hypothetical protein
MSPSSEEGFLLLVPLGGTNNEHGELDADAQARAQIIVDRHRLETATGRDVRVLCSGGTNPQFAFNPTPTSHWVYVVDKLVSCGLDASAIIRPGIEALHTVDEAIMVHKLIVERMLHEDPAERVGELIVLTSDFHAARARHLFGVAIGPHARCPVPHRVEEHAGRMAGEALAARVAHEAKSLEMLRTAPFGQWEEFVRENRLEAANKSKRWSRRMMPASGPTAGDDGRAGSMPPPPPPDRVEVS